MPPRTSRSLAEARGRNVMLAAEAVLESRAFTDREALQATPPLDRLLSPPTSTTCCASSTAGRSSASTAGPSTLRTANAEIRRIDMTRRQRFLGAIAHPQIAYCC